MQDTLDPQSYWQRRHSQTDLGTVGFIGFGVPYNFWMYKVRSVVFNSIVAEQKLNLKQAKILDIGSGSGFYLKRWKALKATDITGSDFSQRALKKLRTTFRKVKLIHLDITSSIPKSRQEKYSLVSAFDILYHIVDDQKYAKAIANISSLLKNGGIFIFSENLLNKHCRRGLYQVSRSRRSILGLLKKNHLKVLTIKPIFYLMNTPIDSESPFLKIFWFLLSNSIIRFNFLGYLLGAILYPIELLLVKTAKDCPSTKIIVCQKMA